MNLIKCKHNVVEMQSLEMVKPGDVLEHWFSKDGSLDQHQLLVLRTYEKYKFLLTLTPTKSETPGTGPSNLCFNKPSR